MSPALPDVNVLIPLYDDTHPSHETAHQWFDTAYRRGWATCPMTVNGCVRILSSPAYRTVTATPAEVVKRLQELCASPAHQFWADDVSLLDNQLFRPALLRGHQQVTDAYLLALAVRHQGQLVTFDRSISIKVVIGAEPRHLRVLGPTRTH